MANSFFDQQKSNEYIKLYTQGFDDEFQYGEHPIQKAQRYIQEKKGGKYKQDQEQLSAYERVKNCWLPPGIANLKNYYQMNVRKDGNDYYLTPKGNKTNQTIIWLNGFGNKKIQDDKVFDPDAENEEEEELISEEEQNLSYEDAEDTPYYGWTKIIVLNDMKNEAAPSAQKLFQIIRQEVEDIGNKKSLVFLGGFYITDPGTKRLIAQDIMSIASLEKDNLDEVQVKEFIEKESPMILDVRSQQVYINSLQAKNSQNIFLKHILNKNWKILPQDRDQPILTLCNRGVMSYYAYVALKGMGYNNVKNFRYGMAGWKYFGLPVNELSPQELGFKIDPSQFEKKF